jgi:hypothetical protein
MTRAHGLDEQSITSFLARFQVDRVAASRWMGERESIVVGQGHRP